MTDVKKLLASAQHRPYTAYNIFFQLEREFILQSILGVTPSVDVAFDQAKDDVIPMLPQKYREIILSYDWYIPGKTQRKKRKHRKSHGKLSFSGKLLQQTCARLLRACVLLHLTNVFVLFL